jgi:PAS domain S-box-containing protein
MSKPFPIPTVNLRRRRQPGLTELEALLDLYPSACLLIDLGIGKVLLANARATEITAFTRTELASQELAVLLPKITLEKLKSASELPSQPILSLLATRNGCAIEVNLSLSRLGSQGAWALLVVEPASLYEERRAQQQRQRELLDNVLILARSTQEADIASAVQLTLQAGHRMTGVDLLAIYLSQPPDSILPLAYTYGDSDLFPEHMPASDLPILLNSPTWMPGKRASAGLQRSARVANLNYLACVQIGTEDKSIGLLAAANRDCPPGEDILPHLNLVATALAVIFQDQSLRTDLSAVDRVHQRPLRFGELVREFSREGVILLSPELSIEELNPAAESMLGYATREVFGQSISDILIGADNLVPALQTALRGIATPNLGDVHLIRRDGVAFLAYIQILPLIVSEIFSGVIILLRDLSEHEQFQVRNQQLEQRAVLGEVTAIFAHEVRNPINNISTGLQVLAMNLPTDDPNQSLIESLKQECNRLNHLMNSVLSFARPLEYRPEVVDLARLIPALIDRWRPRLTRLNVRPEVKITSKTTTILGDPRALEQVFNNLINNAVQAMSDTGGRLAVHIRSGPSADQYEQVQVNVIDSGPGISDEIRQRIFEPFFTTNRNGTGLGLAIAKRILNTHNGTIDVQSVPGGTVFQVILPVLSQTTQQYEHD